MQFAKTCGLFTAKELTILNYCRLYLHVTTVSELFDSKGKHIIPSLFYCHREPWFNTTSVITLQRRPSDYQVKHLWQRLCRQWTASSGTLGLSYQLGSWLKYGNHLRRWRQTYRIPHDTTRVYHWYDTCYWAYLQDSLNPRHYRRSTSTTWTPTSKCIPVEAISQHQNLLVISSSPAVRTTMTPTVRNLSSFASYVHNSDQWVKALIAGVTFIIPPYELMSRIHRLSSSQHVLAVSDGSVKGNHLTYGWVLGSSDGTIFAHHAGSGDGPPTSHRAEAWGMLSVTTFILQLYRFTGRAGKSHPQPILFVSDNLGLVTRVQQRLSYSTAYPNTTLLPDWDIVEQMYTLLTEIPHDEKNIGWVKGHQDDKAIDLTPVAKFNIMADTLANSIHSQKSANPPNPIRLPSAKCDLFIANEMIQGHYLQSIRHAYLFPPYQAYISQRHGWDSSLVEQVDWELLRRAIRRSARSSVQIAKFLHDKLPTRYELSKSSSSISSQCHYCTDTETFSHLLRCHNPLSSSFRTHLRTDAAEYMNKKGFPNQISTIFLQCIEISTAPVPLDNDPLDICLRQQMTLGPNALLKGFLHKSWNSRLTHDLSRTTGEESHNSCEMLAGLVHVVWTAQLDFWKSHTSKIQPNAPNLTEAMHNKTSHYQTRIRQLYSLRDQCLHGHRDQYFPPALEDYLATSTLTQMKQYLFYYETAIHQSIKQARAQTQRRITTFPGFIRNAGQTLRQFTSTKLPSSPSLFRRPSGVQGAPTHHRHTRWRHPIPSMSLKTFFPPKSD